VSFNSLYQKRISDFLAYADYFNQQNSKRRRYACAV